MSKKKRKPPAPQRARRPTKPAAPPQPAPQAGPKADPGGRPNGLTPEVVARVLQALRDGNYREVAAAAAGVPQRTFTRWCTLGRKGEQPYAGFWLAVLEAEQSAETDAVRRVLLCGQGDPKHLQWWLERKFPQRWGSHKGELAALKRRVAELEKDNVRGAAHPPPPGPPPGEPAPPQ